MDLQEIKRFCNKEERELIALEAERKTLQNLLEEHEVKLLRLETSKENNKKAGILVRQIAQETRTHAIATVEEIITDASRDIYSPDYLFSMDMKELSSKESENTGQFTILPSIEKLIDGKLVKRPIKGSNGGGLQEIISILLRIAFGVFNGYQGVYIFDEALSAVSKDEVMERLLLFLDRYIRDLGLQVILITHSAEKFSQISSINYIVYKEDGIAKAKQASKDDIMEMQNFDVST